MEKGKTAVGTKVMMTIAGLLALLVILAGALCWLDGTPSSSRKAPVAAENPFN